MAGDRITQRYCVYDDFNHAPLSYHKTIAAAGQTCDRHNQKLLKAGYVAIYCVMRHENGKCVPLTESEMDELDEYRNNN